MFHRFHDRFGTAGVVIAIIALIAALGGTALAAGGLSSKQKKEVTKIAKKYAGKPGAAGTNGTNGTNGAAGAKGDKGDTGGTGGTGIAGKNVVTADYTGTECATATEEGATVEVEGTPASKKYVCDGEEGPQGGTGGTGNTGSPWVVGTAPSGAVLKGTWSVHSSNAAAGEQLPINVSFSVPVNSASPWLVDVVPAGGPDPLAAIFGGPVCAGNAGEPTGAGGAGAGEALVCVYVSSATNLSTPATGSEIFTGTLLSSKGGTVSKAKATIAAPVEAYGSWAVTAP